MSISTPFIQRPIATSLVMAALVLVGIAAYPLLPVAPLPRVDFPTIVVSGSLPGASPETMAATVAQPLETQIAQIPGVAQMTSVSVLGTTSVTVQFDLDRNIDGAAGDIQAAIQAASGQLPKIMPGPPTYRKVNPSDAPVMILAAQSDAMPLTDTDDYSENVLSQQISQIAGVAQVLIGGQQKRAVRVEAEPDKLAAMGLTLEDVRNLLVNATVDGPKGSIDGEHKAYTVYDNDQLTHASQYDNVVLAYRNGAAVRVRDIGRAIDGPENRLLAGWQNGKRGILLIIFKQPGANVIETVQRIKDALPQLEASIPPSIHVSTIMDRTLTIRASVADVQFTLILAVCLVVMVIFVFLRNVWATIIPSTTVPVALICTFGVMYLLDYSLDNLSLMALTLAVGFVIDDAIVMLENIFRHVEEGMKPMEAAIKGAGEIGFTIVSISFSLVAVFIPLLFMGGIVGRLFREFAVTVTAAVLVSAFVCLTLTPMMCSRFLRHDTSRHGWAYRAIEAMFNGLIAFYRRTLDIALRHHFITLLVFLGTVSLSVYLYIIIPKGFFPPQDNGVVLGITEAAQDVSFKEMVNVQQRLADIVAQDPDTGSFVSSMGGGFGGQSNNIGRLFISLKPLDERVGGSLQNYINRLRPKIAQVQGGKLFLQPVPDVRVGARLAKTEYQYTLPGREPGRTLQMGPQDPGQAAVTADVARRNQRPAGRRHHRDTRDRSRRRCAVRHTATGDRRHAVRRIRPAADRPVFLAGELLSRDPGGPAGHGWRPGDAGQAVREVADRSGRYRSPASFTGARCRYSHCRSAIRASSRRSPSPSTLPPGLRSARPLTPSTRRCGRWACRSPLPDHSRAPRRRSSRRWPASPI